MFPVYRMANRRGVPRHNSPEGRHQRPKDGRCATEGISPAPAMSAVAVTTWPSRDVGGKRPAEVRVVALPKPTVMRLLVVCLLATCARIHAGTNAFGKKFLEENAKKPGVITTSSGLQYKVLEEGDGDTHPQISSDCTCHYEGRIAQEYSKEPKGKKFDSSFDRGSPTNFPPSGVIAGWTEAMQLMREGCPSRNNSRPLPALWWRSHENVCAG